MRGGFLSKYTCGMGKNKGSSMIIGGITDIGCGVCRSTNTRYSLELLNPNFTEGERWRLKYYPK
jgi:hypothetical protein